MTLCACVMLASAILCELKKNRMMSLVLILFARFSCNNRKLAHFMVISEYTKLGNKNHAHCYNWRETENWTTDLSESTTDSSCTALSRPSAEPIKQQTEEFLSLWLFPLVCPQKYIPEQHQVIAILIMSSFSCSLYLSITFWLFGYSPFQMPNIVCSSFPSLVWRLQSQLHQ